MNCFNKLLSETVVLNLGSPTLTEWIITCVNKAWIIFFLLCSDKISASGFSIMEGSVKIEEKGIQEVKTLTFENVSQCSRNIQILDVHRFLYVVCV